MFLLDLSGLFVVSILMKSYSASLFATVQFPTGIIKV